MKFWSFYSKRLIAGIKKDELMDILNGQNKDVSVKVINNGSILLSGKINKVVKCVGEYYEPVRKPDKEMVKSSNAMIKCQMVREYMGVNSSRMECLHCHRTCLRLQEQKVLKRKE